MRLRSIIRRFTDAVVPDRYWIAYDFAVDRLLGRLEEELVLLDRLPAGRGTAIDVGANKGHYAYRMSRTFEKVYAFEPNAALTGKLERLRSPRVKVLKLALGDEVAVVRLHIPIVEGRELVGWASFDRDNLPGCTEFREMDVETRPLDSFRIDDVSLIKIDVEGHEAHVLRGARDTIERCRPVLLVEVKEKNRPEIAALISGLGYTTHAWVDRELCEIEGGLDGYVEEKENFIFLPTAGGDR